MSKCVKLLSQHSVFINNPLEVTMADARGFFCAKSWRSSCVSPFLLYAALPDLFPRAIFLLRFNKSLALHVARLALLMTTHGMQTTQPSSSGSGFLSARCTNCSPSSHPCIREREPAARPLLGTFTSQTAQSQSQLLSQLICASKCILNLSNKIRVQKRAKILQNWIPTTKKHQICFIATRWHFLLEISKYLYFSRKKAGYIFKNISIVPNHVLTIAWGLNYILLKIWKSYR